MWQYIKQFWHKVVTKLLTDVTERLSQLEAVERATGILVILLEHSLPQKEIRSADCRYCSILHH